MPLRRLFFLLLLPVLTVPSQGAAVGARLRSAELAPGFPAAASLPRGDLDRAVAAFQRDDLDTAVRELRALTARTQGVGTATRARAHFLLGWIHARQGNHQQSSAHYYRVRKAEDHPLQEMATMLEAQADRLRGHGRTAISECDVYFERYGVDGSFGDECRLIQADAHADLGLLQGAIERYEAFLEANPDDQRAEGISLRLARALERHGSTDSAARRYRVLYLNHRLPTTGVEAEQALQRLEAAGAEFPPISDEDLYVRACSLRATGQHEASYELYCALDERNPAAGEAATPLGKRLDDERHTFLWRNRRYEEVARGSARMYQRDPDAEDAAEHLKWAMDGFARSGLFEEAVAHYELGKKHFPSHPAFRGSEEKAALLYVGAGKYAEAREAWEAWRERSGSARRSDSTRFKSAFAAYRAGQADEALREFTALIDGRSKWATAARYYRSRLHEQAKRWKEARDDRRAVKAADPDGWYAQLVDTRDRRRGQADPVPLRNGGWPGAAPESPPLTPAPPPPLPESITRMLRNRPRDDEPLLLPDDPALRDSDGRLLEGPPDAAGVAAPAPLPDDGGVDLFAVPPAWSESTWWNRERGEKLWADFAAEHAELWPDLPRAYELSRVGLGELAGALLAQVFQELQEVRGSNRLRRRVSRWRAAGGRGTPDEARWAALLDLQLRSRDWMAMFAAAGSPRGVSAFAVEHIPFSNLPRESDEDRKAAWTLTYPAAFGPHVWRHAWENDVDPLLMLSVMRQESVFRHDAVSRAGALGLVQVMPATGAKVAAMAGMEDFRVERLLEPAVNIHLGTFYLGRLLDRFEGQFPLAVGAYNGGPHNIGRWLRGKVGMPFEEFVEEIAFDETRDYIKKVTRNYRIYCDLYAGRALPDLPESTTRDDPSVINF